MMFRNVFFLVLVITGIFSLAAVHAEEVFEGEKQLEIASDEKADVETEELFIQPSDTLIVDVFRERDLSKSVEVSKKGFINYPLIGRVKVGGLTKDEVEQKIYDLFEVDYLVDPQISVKIQRPDDVLAEEEEKSLSAYVLLGEVKKPGTYEFDPEDGKMTLLKAISIAGGFSEVANMKKIKMLRRKGSETIAFTVNAKDIIEGKHPDEEIYNDDLIVVSESLI